MQRRRIELVIVTPLVFGMPYRQLGIGNQFMGIMPILGVKNHANTGRCENVLTFDTHRLNQGFDHSTSNNAGLLAVTDIGQKD